MPVQQYSAEQAEEDTARTRGDVDRMAEHFRTARCIAKDPTTGYSNAADETWHTLGALGAHYTVTRGRYRLTPNNEVQIEVEVIGDGLQATTVAFANTLPAAYQPATDHTSLPMGTTRVVTAGDISPRISVLASGTINVINQGTANTFSFAGNIALD